MEIEFTAVLPDVQTAIGISGDGSSRIRLDVSQDDLPQVLKLVLLKGKTFQVKVTDEVKD